MNKGTNYASLFFSNIENDIDTLEKNVKEFPFSSVARFLLLYYHKKNNKPAFENLAQRTGIYINDPFWIQFQLSKIDDEPFSIEDSLQFKKLNENANENFSVATNESEIAANEPTCPAGRQITQIPVSENEVANESEIKNISSEEKIQNENIKENIPVAVETEIAASEQITQIPVSENEVANESEIKNISSEENITENIPSTERSEITADEQIMQVPVFENEVANKNEIKNNSSEENITENIPSTERSEITADEQIMQIPVFENEVSNESEIKNNSYEEKIQNENIEENIPAAVETEIAADEPTCPVGRQITQIPVSENISIENEIKVQDSPSKDLGPEIKSSENNEEDMVPFEPLHTVDYFASQGIKITEDELENDHLGKQVKSFTAWLKSMKKLHPGQLPEQNEVIEKIIQTNAEVSNQNANVLTEAMAEVLIKQNKKEKAVEMYQKLSLINPSKNAYFAAKIESLKII